MYTVIHKCFWSIEHEARALDKKSYKRNLQIQSKFTEMFLMMPSTKFVQMVLR